MAKALTGVALTKLKADRSKRLEIPDGVLTGLYFIIQPTGRRSWAVRYRHGGAPRKLALGNYLAGDDPAKAGEELKRMRREAGDILESVRGGADPAAEKQAAKRQAANQEDIDRDKFRTIAERYLKEYAAKRRNFPEKARLLGMRLKDHEWMTIADRPASLWGDKRIQEITRRDVREHLERLADAAPIGANRAFSELRKFFNWVVGKDILDASPLVGLQPPSEENASRNRVLIRRKEVPGSSDKELLWLWQACEAYGEPEDNEGKGGIGKKYRGPFGAFVQMLILTGQRRTEVAAMTWHEVDLDAREWVIPGTRAKNGDPHIVPLSDEAVTVLNALPRFKSSDFVFTTDGETPISGFSRMKKRIDKLMAEKADEVPIPAWTLHDIRRTVAAGMQRLGIKMEVTEKVLNHTSGSFGGIAGVYQVHDYADEKRAALDAWGTFVTNLTRNATTDNVIELRAAK